MVSVGETVSKWVEEGMQRKIGVQGHLHQWGPRPLPKDNTLSWTMESQSLRSGRREMRMQIQEAERENKTQKNRDLRITVPVERVVMKRIKGIIKLKAWL